MIAALTLGATYLLGAPASRRLTSVTARCAIADTLACDSLPAGQSAD